MCLNKLARLLFFVLLLFIFYVDSYSASVDLGLSYSKNTTEKKGVDISYKFEKFKLNFSGGFMYFKDEKEVTSNNGFISTGYDTQLSGKWYLWSFDKLLYDRVQQINYENHLGAGIKYVFVDTDALKTSFSTGFLYDRTVYEGNKDKNKIRISNRYKLLWLPYKKVNVNFISFYQPDIANFADYIITSEFIISYILSDRLSIKFKLEDTYRSYTLSDYYNDLYTNLIFSFNF
jgi:hypothetical protein